MATPLRKRDEDWFLYPDLIDAFSELAVEDFGFNGRVFPVGVDKVAMNRTVSRCLGWLERNRPRS